MMDQYIVQKQKHFLALAMMVLFDELVHFNALSESNRWIERAVQ